jgi:hypothetical protein
MTVVFVGQHPTNTSRLVILGTQVSSGNVVVKSTETSFNWAMRSRRSHGFVKLVLYFVFMELTVKCQKRNTEKGFQFFKMWWNLETTTQEKIDI